MHSILPTDLNKPTDRRILVFSSTFPSEVHPAHGVFVKERVRHVAELPGYSLRVVSPVPWFPPLRGFKRWYPLSQIRRREMIDGLDVLHPRYLLLPKVGGSFHAASMARGVRRTVAGLKKNFPFDLIDAHFIFPDGVAAAKLAQRFSCPLVITARGEDILRFPSLPVIGDQIRDALRAASQLIAVSQEIAEKMEREGADPAKITVIPNGVDTETFRPHSRNASRRQLNLPTNRPIVLSVGNRLERKGFELLVESLNTVRRRYPDILAVIVGGPARSGRDNTKMIQQRIRDCGVSEHVRLVDERDAQELPLWYSAADLFVLLTSREGCPNVLLEAMACGLPAIATRVGQIPQLLADDRLGILLPERSAAAGAQGIIEALGQTWDRCLIRGRMESHSWQQVSAGIDAVFDRVLEIRRSRTNISQP